ncbi:MAG: hypothetical protein KGI62_05115 [Xanthomonadaceae bacterium]|nr:hypothetical protein [Xanthomonadaceae bacterium]
MAGSEATNAPLAVPRMAAGRRSKRRMFEHMDVRVRRGRRSASIAGQSNKHDVRSTIATGAMVFGYISAETESSSPAAEASETKAKAHRTCQRQNGFRSAAE